MVKEKNKMKLHDEVLSTRQEQLVQKLGPIASEHGFYLVGGTALALLLGHRHSVDFDWFTDRAFDDPLRFASLLQKDFAAKIISYERGTLHVFISGVRVSFLQYQYYLLQPVIEWKRNRCSLASLDDLACMKLSAIAQRGSKKDFIDLYALLMKHKSLTELLTLYRKKYQIEDIIHIIYALCYFQDADRERTPRMMWDINWNEIKAVILKAAKDYY